MDIARLEQLVQEQEDQLNHHVYQYNTLMQQSQQLAANINATMGSVQMLQRLLDEAKQEAGLEEEEE